MNSSTITPRPDRVAAPSNREIAGAQKKLRRAETRRDKALWPRLLPPVLGVTLAAASGLAGLLVGAAAAVGIASANLVTASIALVIAGAVAGVLFATGLRRTLRDHRQRFTLVAAAHAAVAELAERADEAQLQAEQQPGQLLGA